MILLSLLMAIFAMAQMPNGAFIRSSMNCTLDGVKVQNGDSITAYQSKLPVGANSCSAGGNTQTRACKNTVLTGTYPYATCTNGCTSMYWGSVSAGSSFTRYNTMAPNPGFTCAGSSQTYTCSGGNIPTPSLPYNYTSCADPCVAQTVQWTVGSATCSYTTTSGYQSGTSGTLTDSTAPTTGSATAVCTDGTVVLSNTTCTNSACASGGVKVGGYCWYLGSAGQSCTTVCSAAGRGGYNTATQSYAGNSPAGNKSNCNSIFNELGVSGTLTSEANCTAGGVYDGLGCAKLQSTGRAWCKLTAATAEASESTTQRVCACVN